MFDRYSLYTVRATHLNNEFQNVNRRIVVSTVYRIRIDHQQQKNTHPSLPFAVLNLIYKHIISY